MSKKLWVSRRSIVGVVFLLGLAVSMAAMAARYTQLSVDELTIPTGGKLIVGSSTLTVTELAAQDGITAGTVTASKGVIVDSNKDIGDFRNLDAVNIDAGASATAGSVDVFPTTAAKGKIAIVAADSAGDTTTTITNASQAGARTYTIPDAGASASYVMTEGAATINGAKTFSSDLVTSSGVGAKAGANVTAVENGDGTVHKTVLTLAAQAITLTDEAGVVLYGGLKVYDFPAGVIKIHGATADLTVAVAGNLVADADGDVGLGTITASNNSTLASTEQDILPTTAIPQLVASAGTADAIPTADVAPINGTSTAADAYLNFLWDDADHNGGTMTASGTVTIIWSNLGDV